VHSEITLAYHISNQNIVISIFLKLTEANAASVIMLSFQSDFVTGAKILFEAMLVFFRNWKPSVNYEGGLESH